MCTVCLYSWLCGLTALFSYLRGERSSLDYSRDYWEQKIAPLSFLLCSCGCGCLVRLSGAALQSTGLLLPGTIHATLDEATLGSGRLIVIGDVHGCVVELRELLAKVDFRQGNDTVVLVGDSVDKGPRSLEVGLCLDWRLVSTRIKLF